MKRFLVLQSFFVGEGDSAQDLKEPVIDFEEMAQAQEWVNQQPDPTLFEIEDQFPEDNEVEHDFEAYDSYSPTYGADWDDEDYHDYDDLLDEESDEDYPDFDGDGDAD
jgi:hypothetical protein